MVIIGVASVVEPETSVESGAKAVIAGGSHKGLRHVDLGHWTRAGPERAREMLWEQWVASYGRRPGEGRIICRIEIRPHAAVSRRVREADVESQTLLQFVSGVNGKGLTQLLIGNQRLRIESDNRIVAELHVRPQIV